MSIDLACHQETSFAVAGDYYRNPQRCPTLVDTFIVKPVHPRLREQRRGGSSKIVRARESGCLL